MSGLPPLGTGPTTRRRAHPARAEQLDRFGRRDLGLVEALDALAFEMNTEGPLDPAQRQTILGCHQADRRSLFTGASGAAAAMDLILGLVRQIKIDHV